MGNRKLGYGLVAVALSRVRRLEDIMIVGDLDFDLGDFNLGDLNLGDFDFDFGDFDFGDFDLGDLGGGFGDFDFDMCAGGDFIAFGDGGSCWCTITSTSSEGDEREYSGILDMIMDFSFILENGEPCLKNHKGK